MAERGRKPGFHMTEEHRTKIGNSQILNRLVDFVEGRVEMSSAQVTAALGLLKKVLPDLQRSEMSGLDGSPIETTANTRDIARAILDILGTAKVGN